MILLLRCSSRSAQKTARILAQIPRMSNQVSCVGNVVRSSSVPNGSFQPKPLPHPAPASTPPAMQPDSGAATDPFSSHHSPQQDQRHLTSDSPPPNSEDTSLPLWLSIPWVLCALAPLVGWHVSRVERMYDPALPCRDTIVGEGQRYTAGEGALPSYATPPQLAAQAQAAKHSSLKPGGSKTDGGASVLGVKVKGAEYLHGGGDAPGHTGARWDPLRRNFTDIIKDDKGVYAVQQATSLDSVAPPPRASPSQLCAGCLFQNRLPTRVTSACVCRTGGMSM